jgi:bla regulator protein BlaR1
MTLLDLSPLENHLWQSTLCVGVAWLLALAFRKNRAAVRYCIWLAASVKFLIPFSLFVSIGAQFGWRTAPSISQSHWSVMMDDIGQPFATSVPSTSVVTVPAAHWAPTTPAIVLGIWLCGFVLGIAVWLRSWRQMRSARRNAEPLALDLPIPTMSTMSVVEPSVFGVLRPVLLLPEGIISGLTPDQFAAIAAHEICHVRRQDNFTAAIHMAVETAFWFHPLLWWIRTRLVQERECACDEEVLCSGSKPAVYAEGILKVCKFYLESPLLCTAGVTGSNLKKRIEAIMAHRTPQDLHFSKRLLLITISCAALILPIALGALHAAQDAAESRSSQIVTASFYNAPPVHVYKAISIKPHKPVRDIAPVADFRPDGLTGTNVTVLMLIQQAYGVEAFQISGAPDWLNRDRYDVAAEVDDSLTEELSKSDVSQLAAAQQPMLLELLADRFDLSVHRETRQLPVFTLVVAKIGSTFREATPGDTYPNGIKDSSGNGHGEMLRWRRGQVVGQGIPIGVLAQHLSRELGRPVLDRTALIGKYDFTLQWSDIRMFPREYMAVPGTPRASTKGMELDPPSAQSAEFSGPSIFTALHDQLGLDLLESDEQTSPAQILVIDGVEKPSEN